MLLLVLGGLTVRGRTGLYEKVQMCNKETITHRGEVLSPRSLAEHSAHGRPLRMGQPREGKGNAL